jgi:hypothetical protein
MRSNHPRAKEIDRVAAILMAAWAKAEPKHKVTLYPTSYIATFVDMARAVVEAGIPPEEGISPTGLGTGVPSGASLTYTGCEICCQPVNGV